MAGPWEKYGAKEPAGPWAKYAKSDQAPDQPWYAQAAQAADDMARLAANGVTLGFADKLAGYMGGEGTEAERAKSDEAMERAGTAGKVAEVGGAIAAPMGAAKYGATLLQPALKAIPGALGLGARTGAMAAEGSGYGALAALGNDEDIGEGALWGAGAGALGNVAGEGASAAIGKIASLFNKKPAIPSVEDLRSTAKTAYQRADDAGTVFAPEAVDTLTQGVSDDLAAAGFHPRIHPKIAVAADEIASMAGKPATFQQMEQLRRIAGSAGKSLEPDERRIASILIDNIDEFGRANGGPDLADARNAWSRVRKSEMLDEAVEKAERRSAANSGSTGTKVRQNIASILDNPKRSRGFSAEEREALEAAVRGSKGENFAKLVGKLAPTGVVSGGLGASMGAAVGGTLLGPGGAAAGAVTLPAIGQIAKILADRSILKNADFANDVIRAGSRSAATPPPNAAQRFAGTVSDPVARILMALGVAP